MGAPAGVSHAGDDPLKAWLHTNVPHVVRELLAGGAAGAVAKTCVAPLERTKILLMTGRSRASAFSTLRLIVASEGVRGLFRGNAASCLRIMPYAAIHFSVYEAYRRMLSEHFLPTPEAAAVVATRLTGTGNGTGAGGAVGGGRGGLLAGTASPSPSPAAEQLLSSTHHLGEDVPPTPMSSSIDVSATAVITTVEEEQREDEEEQEPAQQLNSTPPYTPATAVAGASAAAPLQHDVTAPPTHHHHDQHSYQHQRRRQGPILDLVAGSAAGATAVLLTYPLDMVRTRMAWAIDGASRKSAAAVAAVAQGAGRGAGRANMAAATAAIPALSAPSAPPAHHTRIGAMLVHTMRHEGPLGLYRGLAPTLYGIMPYAGLKFFVYGSLKQWYRESLHPPSTAAGRGSGGVSSHVAGGHGGSERLPVPYMLAFGGASGLLAQTVTYPLDVIRRRMQVHGMQQEAAAAEGAAPTTVGASAPRAAGLTTWGVARSIVGQDGVRGLFRGLSLNYVKVVPSTAIGFTVYDMFKSYLGVTGNI